MVKKELGRRNFTAGIYLIGLITLTVRTKLMGQDPEDAVSTILICITSFSLIAACAFYLRANAARYGG